MVNPDPNTAPAIGGNYQMIDADTDFWGNLIADGSIGVVDAGSVATDISGDQGLSPIPFGAPLFELNADGLHPGATFDLLDSAGDLGNDSTGGPYIDVGAGGQFRYLVVGGNIFQNEQYGTGGPFSSEQVPHDIPISQPVLLGQGQGYVLTDSSGGSVALSPTSVPANPDQGTPQGQTPPTTTNTGTPTPADPQASCRS